jgi:predicted secreted protein
MKLGSIIAIYVLFWTMTAFVVMPFHVRTHDEAGAPLVPGQAESAPYDFPFRKVLLRITLLSALLFAAFYLNYHYGWISPRSLTTRRLP